jgi:hypothetical protein
MLKCTKRFTAQRSGRANDHKIPYAAMNYPPPPPPCSKSVILSKQADINSFPIRCRAGWSADLRRDFDREDG